METEVNIEDRFLSKVDKTEGCWEWKAAIKTSGYGAFNVNGENAYAHRVSYELFVGKIKEGFHVCHTCDNRKCVRPDHLFLGTHLDNMRDMNKKGRHFSPWSGKTHCKHGHEFTEENTYWRIGKNKRHERVCRKCNKKWIQKTKEK